MRSLAFLSLIVLFISACNKGPVEGIEHCPAFDTTFMSNWFPHYNTIGSSFAYVNNNGGKIFMTTSYVNYGGAYTYPYSFGAYEKRKTVCDVNGQIILVLSIPPEINRYGDTIYKTMRMKHTNIAEFQGNFGAGTGKLTIDLDNSRFYINTQNNNMLDLDFKQYTHSEIHTSYNFHDKSYNTVFIATTTGKEVLESTYGTFADKIYFAKGYGLIGFRTHPDGVEYWLE